MAGIFALLTMLFLASLLTEASAHVLALYVFEDAIVDGGNTQPTPPHGIDLNTTISIRWTNEKLMLISLVNFGFFLLLLSVSVSLSPSLLFFMVLYPMILEISSYTSGLEISKTDVNYGQVGCGLLHRTGPKNCSFEDQIGQFNLTVANDLTKAFNEQELVQHLTSSVFLVSFGINDYSPNYLSSGVVSKMAPQEFAKMLLNEMSMALKTLYRLSARKFVVKNIWPLWRTPNFLIIPYSNSLPSMLNDLQFYLTGDAFSHSNDFLFVTALMQNSGKYGYGKLLLNYDI
ncbi:hypothetical protein CsSME_00043413 [Camellia sinensis var. sinensis]